ncbi:MAG: 4-hydroxythreonine-4-phosphate dehydrogenase PdxA [Chromatiales bacterium]|nr:4-hydroxythreonine-4-phosphate dehydrogenase PdxA [Chromatiales bacterium]
MTTLAVTTGEPAGVGPDLALGLATRAWPAGVVLLGDRDLLAARARLLGLDVTLHDWQPGQAASRAPGSVSVLHVPLGAPCRPGRLDTANAPYVLALLRRAVAGCRSGEFAAMVTAPVQKSVINDAGVPFAGHTEFLAAETGAPLPVMMLVAGSLRVALVTTHLPLAAVPAAITGPLLDATLGILDGDLRRRFHVARPRILVLGVNPHAGESGHLGREEIDTLVPALVRARTKAIDAVGPLPADTAFVPRHLEGADAVLAMYHDQGLPVLKHRGFGRAVNVTLGLPIVRTSVDHGTALDLAGTGRADGGSLAAAVELAIDLSRP